MVALCYPALLVGSAGDSAQRVLVYANIAPVREAAGAAGAAEFWDRFRYGGPRDDLAVRTAAHRLDSTG